MRLIQRLHAAGDFLASSLLLLLLAGCGAETSPPPPPVTQDPVTLLNIGVSDNAAALADAWATAYAATTDRASVNVVAGNNAALFADLATEQLDAILVHHISEAESDRWFNPVALDGLIIVVHVENSVESLSQGQVQSLFSGEIGNWSAVGGPDLAVVPVAQERGDGARTVFTRRIMGARPVSINTIIQTDSANLLEAVGEQPGAIGYTSMSALTDVAADGPASGAVKAIAIDGIAPAPATTTSQEYPLTVPLYFVAREEPQGELRAFLAWLQSDAGQATVSEIVGSVR